MHAIKRGGSFLSIHRDRLRIFFFRGLPLTRTLSDIDTGLDEINGTNFIHSIYIQALEMTD